MKKSIFFVIFFGVFAMCSAQTEPEFEFEPYVFCNTDSTFDEPLSCESTYIKSKAGASMFLTGIGKIKTYYYIKGKSSSVKLNKGENCIIINMGDVSPQQVLSLIKLEQLENKRRWKTGEVGSFTGASMGEDNSIQLRYKRYGENSFIINTNNLESGEYCLAITYMMSNVKSGKVYTFSIE